MALDQEYEVRVEWGRDGLNMLLPGADVVVIVDVLSFSTCVDVAVSHGMLVYPYPEFDRGAEEYAKQIQAQCAGRRGVARYSLSVSSFSQGPKGERVVLPSPNGAALSVRCGAKLTLSGCLRNATAVAEFVARRGRNVLVVAAGERWESGGLRPALEDLVGTGAIVRRLSGRRSPEAELSVHVLEAVEDRLERVLLRCTSGRELTQRGFSDDVTLAAELDVSGSVPILDRSAFIDALEVKQDVYPHTPDGL